MHKFIGQYPLIDDENLIYKITKKKEFWDYKERSENSGRNKSSKDPIKNSKSCATPLPHQKILQNLVSPNTPFRKILVDHDPGTGKTCTSILINENFVQNVESADPEGGSVVRKALVFVPNEQLIKNYVHEIERMRLEKYTYKPTDEDLSKGITMNLIQRRSLRKIRKSYEITTPGRFWSSAATTFGKGNLPKEKLKKLYSGWTIILDESHIYRKKPGKSAKDKRMRKIYAKMMEFLDTLEDITVVLLTATPIRDRTEEIAGQFNLLLPEDERLPTGKSFINRYFDGEKLINVEELEKAFLGRTSYVRGLVADVQKNDVGESEPYMKYLTIYPDVLSEHQEKYSRKYLKEDQKKLSTYRKSRSANVFVWPDGSTGNEGFEKYVRKIGKSYKFRDEKIKKDIQKNLRKYSIKFYNIIQNIKDNPKKKVFIYSEFVHGSGAVLLALIFPLFGLSKASGFPSSPKKDRFAVITGDSWTINEPTKITKFIREFNKPKNRYGEFVRVIIGSGVIGVGITLKDVRIGHNLIPFFNMATIKQAMGRITRFGSFNALLKDGVDVIVEIYKHAAVYKDANYVKGDRKDLTADLVTYKIAEKKDVRDTSIYRLLKKTAIDCALNYGRNVQKTDVAGSRDCDYQDCNYICHDYDENLIDKKEKQIGGEVGTNVYQYNIEGFPTKTTFNVYHSSEDIEKMVKEIKLLFRNYFSLTLDAIAELVSSEDDFILLSALDKLINGEVPIRNRYGILNTLREQNNMYYLESPSNLKSKYVDVYMVSNMYITEKTSLRDLIEIDQLSTNLENLSDILSNLDEQFDKLYPKTRIILLERLLVKKERNEVEEKLLKKMSKYYYKVRSKDKVPFVIVHILWDPEFDFKRGNLPKTLKITNEMRILKMGEKSFQTVEDEEVERYYLNEINKLRHKKGVARKESLRVKESLETLDSYIGIYSKRDRKFRIKGPKFKKGAVCMTVVPKSRLYDLIFNELEYFPKTNAFQDLDKETLTEMISNILFKEKFKIKDNWENVYDENSMRWIMKVVTSSKSEICGILKDYFKKNKLLQYI